MQLDVQNNEMLSLPIVQSCEAKKEKESESEKGRIVESSVEHTENAHDYTHTHTQALTDTEA